MQPYLLELRLPTHAAVSCVRGRSRREQGGLVIFAPPVPRQLALDTCSSYSGIWTASSHLLSDVLTASDNLRESWQRGLGSPDSLA